LAAFSAARIRWEADKDGLNQTFDELSGFLPLQDHRAKRLPTEYMHMQVCHFLPAMRTNIG
jgi:hypothetical protein